jgi:A/G-specific adenine glycosylase
MEKRRRDTSRQVAAARLRLARHEEKAGTEALARAGRRAGLPLVSFFSADGRRQHEWSPSRADTNRIERLVAPFLHWFAGNARQLPWRRTLDPYAIWVSEIMLQQTQVKTVIPYWQRWMRELPTVRTLAEASPQRVLKLWEGLGYYTRARNLQTAARQIMHDHAGRFPNAFDEILSLPGIGRYTAGAITSIAFNQPAPILDGNVVRVLTRLFGITENPKEKGVKACLWLLAEALVTRAAANSQFSILNFQLPVSGAASALNQSLMELGALVCTPRLPRCDQCPVGRRCVAHQTDQVQTLPNLGPRVASSALHFAAFVVQRGGRWLVRQRPAGMVNAHLWEFPNLEVSAGTPAAGAAARLLGGPPQKLVRLTTVKHTITRYRISLEAWLVNVAGNISLSDHARWLSLKELDELPFTSAHRKVLQVLRERQNPVRNAGTAGAFAAESST